MSITISDRQLRALEDQRVSAVIIRDARKNKGYAVMPEDVFDRARPLLEFVAGSPDAPASPASDDWTEEKNARRVALVNKKYDLQLSAAEECELASLQAEVCRFQERVAPLNNHTLELLLEAVQRRAALAGNGNP